MVRILVAEDDAALLKLVCTALQNGGYGTVACADGAQALAAFEQGGIDMIVTDVMMPALDGFGLAEQVRRTDGRIPILFMTALDDKTAEQRGFALGADDYVVKPFDPRELLARIRTVLRRASDKGQAAAQSDIRRFAGWTLNVRSRELSQGDERIALSDAMYRLLLVFLDEPFAVLSREYLLRQTQGRDADVFDRSVDIQVSRLRGVLKDTGTSKIIKTVRGGGYMLSVDVEHDA